MRPCLAYAGEESEDDVTIRSGGPPVAGILTADSPGAADAKVVESTERSAAARKIGPIAAAATATVDAANSMTADAGRERIPRSRIAARSATSDRPPSPR